MYEGGNRIDFSNYFNLRNTRNETCQSNTLDFDTIWSALQSKYETIYDLSLKEDSRFETKPKSIIERGDVEDLPYREVVYVLENKTKMPVYIFGYDWRKSSAETAKRLANYVAYLKEKLQ